MPPWERRPKITPRPCLYAYMKARKKTRGGKKDLLLARGAANVLGHFDDERQCVDCALAYRAHAVDETMLSGVVKVEWSQS